MLSSIPVSQNAVQPTRSTVTVVSANSGLAVRRRFVVEVRAYSVLSPHLFSTSGFVDAPAGVTQEETHTGFIYLPSAMLAFIFLARRIQPFLSLVDREFKILRAHELITLHLLTVFNVFVLFFYFL